MIKLGTRVGSFFVRAPYVVAVITLAAMLIVFDTSRSLNDAHGQRGWLNWLVVGFVLYACVALVLLPRLAARAPKSTGASLGTIRWAVGSAPFLAGCGAWSIGADEWSAIVGSVASAVLVVVAARITASTDALRT